MISIQKPEDIVSLVAFNILMSRKDDKEFCSLVHNWNKKIVINILDFYPINVIFQGDDITFNMGDIKKASLKVKMTLNTLLDVAYGRTGLIKAVLNRKLKVKGKLKIRSLLKFIKIFLVSLKMLTEQENQNYFEINKITR